MAGMAEWRGCHTVVNRAVETLPRGGSNGVRWRHYRMAKHHRAHRAGGGLCDRQAESHAGHGADTRVLSEVERLDEFAQIVGQRLVGGVDDDNRPSSGACGGGTGGEVGASVAGAGRSASSQASTRLPAQPASPRPKPCAANSRPVPTARQLPGFTRKTLSARVYPGVCRTVLPGHTRIGAVSRVEYGSCPPVFPRYTHAEAA